MNRITRCILAAALVLTVTGAHSANSDVTPSPQELINTVNESSSVRLQGSPYQLTADLVLTPPKSAEIHGRITYYRDRDHDRIEITAGEYHETRVRAGDKLYVTSTGALVLPRRHMLETLEEVWTIHYSASCCLAFGKVDRKKTQGADSYCFRVESQNQRPKRFCADRDKKSLLETFDGFETVNLMDYRTLEGLQYPSRVQVIDDGKMFLEIRDIEIRKRQAAPESFSVPPGSQEFETCSDKDGPHALHLSVPPVPSRRHSSYASVNGLVQTDGSYSDIQVQVSPADPGFALALKEHALQWKFSPARCGSKAVVSEEQMETHN